MLGEGGETTEQIVRGLFVVRDNDHEHARQNVGQGRH